MDYYVSRGNRCHHRADAKNGELRLLRGHEHGLSASSSLLKVGRKTPDAASLSVCTAGQIAI